jgi:hypothetical protein
MEHEIFRCARCGKQALKRTYNQKYCLDCASKANLERTKRWKEKHPEECRGGKQPEPRGPERGNQAVDRTEAGASLSLKGKTADRVSAEARALGLSYGKYSALVLGGGIDAWLKYHKISWRCAFREIGKK